MDKVRMLAAKLLMRCEEQGYSNLVVKSALDRDGLELRDRQFISALVYGTLEKQRLLDAILNQFLKKPCAKLDAPVRAVLRSGLYQCRFMESVPDYAAVHAAVDLTRALGKSSASGMVNAVLRRAGKFDAAQLKFKNETERLGTLYSVSDSIARMLQKAYPEQAESILQAFEVNAPLLLRANPLRCTAEQLAERLQIEGLCAQTAALPGVVRLPQGGDLAHTGAFADGWFHVQGISSQMAALAVEAKPGEVILDLCAAPGGKSLTLAEQMQNQGTLICGELQQARISLIEGQLARCGITCARVRCADAAVFDPSLPKADAVLCDVPCSGTGTLAKKPDIRMKNLEQSRAELNRIQTAILQTAASYVKEGGRLVYSTCSLDPAENEKIVQAFLQQNPEFHPQPVEVGSMPCIRHDCGVTLLPEAGENDGFFIAKLIKICYTEEKA